MKFGELKDVLDRDCTIIVDHLFGVDERFYNISDIPERFDEGTVIHISGYGSEYGDVIRICLSLDAIRC